MQGQKDKLEKGHFITGMRIKETFRYIPEWAHCDIRGMVRYGEAILISIRRSLVVVKSFRSVWLWSFAYFHTLRGVEMEIDIKSTHMRIDTVDMYQLCCNT